VKVLWVLFRGICPTRESASEQFNNNVNFYCQGQRFSNNIRHALFTLLISDKPTQNVEKVNTISFYLPGVNHQAWGPIFHCMQESEFEVRRGALEDVNALLHDNFKNSRSVVRTPLWQHWIYLLLCDVPRHNQTATQKTVYAFLLNTLTLIHYSYFSEDPGFYTVILESLQALHLFAGLNNASMKVGHTIMLALVNKLTAQKVSLSSDTNYDSKRWLNMLQLFRVMRRYVFQTAYWRSTNPLDEEKDAEDKKTEEEKKKAAERAALVAAERDGGVLSTEVPAKQQEDRQRLIKLMEDQRRQKQEEFVLAKSRVLKSPYDILSEGEPVITDFGIHWGDGGEAYDLPLIKKFLLLFKACHLDDFDPAASSPNMQATDKAFLLRCRAEFDFWKDTDAFLSILKRQYIDDLHILTYRKLSFVVQSWVRTSSSSSRESIVSDMKYMLANKGADRPVSKPDSKLQVATARSGHASSPSSLASPSPSSVPSGSVSPSTKDAVASPASASAAASSPPTASKAAAANKSSARNQWG